MSLIKMITEAAARMLVPKAPAPQESLVPMQLFSGQRTNKRRNLERKEMARVGGRRQYLKLVKAQRRAEKSMSVVGLKERVNG